MPMIQAPFLDKAATAGRPVPIDDDYVVTSYRWLPSPFGHTPGDNYLGIYITGESLIDRHILDGDWVLCRLCDDAMPGQLVAVATPYGLTVKFWRPRGDGSVELGNANDKFKPQPWLDTELTIRGVVVMVGRDWE